MAKRVGIIDLGSNSARLAIFERTSRLGFYEMAEFKTKVRLGEGAYENGGMLQEKAMEKCFLAFTQFKKLLKKYSVNRAICVGTSALRDAPNSKVFINKIKKELGLNLRVIDGNEEAYFGGIAVSNLLSPLSNAVTMDIGGGSTELALMKDGKIIDTISLNIGTVRLKELFFDKKDLSGMREFAAAVTAQIPSHFRSENIIAIGGSLRAIASSVMQKCDYPLEILHNFSYDLAEFTPWIEKICAADVTELEKFHIKKDRFDTIREGAFIFLQIAQILGAREIFTSGVGVREGIFLDRLLGKNGKFPKNFNPSLKCLQDRFSVAKTSNLTKFAKEIFINLAQIHKIGDEFLPALITAAKITNTGVCVDFYEKHNHSYYLVLNTLNFGYTHKERALIAAIIRVNGRKNIDSVAKLRALLPDEKIVVWLSFILKLAEILDDAGNENLSFKFENSTLKIGNIKNDQLTKDLIKKMSKPGVFAINFE